MHSWCSIRTIIRMNFWWLPRGPVVLWGHYYLISVTVRCRFYFTNTPRVFCFHGVWWRQHLQQELVSFKRKEHLCLHSSTDGKRLPLYDGKMYLTFTALVYLNPFFLNQLWSPLMSERNKLIQLRNPDRQTMTSNTPLRKCRWGQI